MCISRQFFFQAHTQVTEVNHCMWWNNRKSGWRFDSLPFSCVDWPLCRLHHSPQCVCVFSTLNFDIDLLLGSGNFLRNMKTGVCLYWKVQYISFLLHSIVNVNLRDFKTYFKQSQVQKYYKTIISSGTPSKTCDNSFNIYNTHST